jgi:nucleotide-binding universal stress UspA family protein
MKPKQTQAGEVEAAASPKLSAPAQPPAGEARLKPIKILVPVDFSRPSGYALLCGGDFARQYGGKITLLTVIEPDPLMRFETHALAVNREALEGRLRAELSEFGHKLAGKGHIEGVLIRHGKPFEQIVKTASALKTDLIIIATHGHTGLKRVLLGSTAERVIRYASCAVLTVRRGQGQGWPAGRN